MARFSKAFPQMCSFIGMIHLPALPGTPGYAGSVDAIITRACIDAKIYKTCGVDGVIVENMHDIPYVKSQNLTPETTALMTRICIEVRRVIPYIPCGVQVLAGGNQEALAIAQAANFQFIRCEGFVFSHIADEGFMDACAGNLLRYRRIIDAENILIFADIKKKHSSHAITGDIDVVETAQAATFFNADGVIITGQSTGDPAKVEDLEKLKTTKKLPVIIGSGVTVENLENYINADAIIVGSSIKYSGVWNNDISEERLKCFKDRLVELRHKSVHSIA